MATLEVATPLQIKAAEDRCGGEAASDALPEEGAGQDAVEIGETPCGVAFSEAQVAGESAPIARIAAALVPVDDSRLLLYGGEISVSLPHRVLSDSWLLGPPAAGWEPCSCPEPTWERWTCGATANESVPTPRSNHAAVTCGDHLLVFGGWGEDRQTPLGHPELLHLGTLCWTHCSTTNEPPPPRGNPTLVYSRERHLAIVYGGWNGHLRFGDVWCLDMESWTWYPAACSASVDDGVEGAGDDEPAATPEARTDHSAVLWRAGGGEEKMLVFGGMTLRGASGELWGLDSTCGAPAEWSWTEETGTVAGPSPPPRTSHAAAIAGCGADASLVVCGGQDASLGAAAAGIIADAWVLSPLGSPERRWGRLAWGGTYPLQRCRHSLAVLGGLAIVYGGYDGVAAVDPHHSLFAAPLDLPAAARQRHRGPADAEETGQVRLQERWEADRPVTVADLPDETRAKASASKLPLAMAKALHRFALAQSPPRDTYIDPDTGYSAFTSAYLKRRPCCGNACRHCPWGHENVPQQSRRRAAAARLDW